MDKALQHLRLESAGLGKNDITYIKSYGCTHIDMMHFIRSQYKLEKYKLDFVSQVFIFQRIKSQ